MIFFTSSLSRCLHLHKRGEDKSKFSVHIVGDDALGILRVKLQCRFYNGRANTVRPYRCKTDIAV